MEPEKQPFEKEIIFQISSFLGFIRFHVNFQWCMGILGGGSPVFGEDLQFLLIFFRWVGSTTHQV